MRAPLLRRTLTRAVLLGGLLTAAGFAACADAIHLDPPSPDGGSSSTGPTAGCHSNPDCAFPTPVCDTVTAKCVGCLTVSDCAYLPGTVCSKGECGCPTTLAAPLTLCASQTPACVDVQTSLSDCGACGKACSTKCDKGKCAAGMGGGTTASTAASSSTVGSGGGVGVGGSATGTGGADAG